MDRLDEVIEYIGVFAKRVKSKEPTMANDMLEELWEFFKVCSAEYYDALTAYQKLEADHLTAILGRDIVTQEAASMAGIMARASTEFLTFRRTDKALCIVQEAIKYITNANR